MEEYLFKLPIGKSDTNNWKVEEYNNLTTKLVGNFRTFTFQLCICTNLKEEEKNLSVECEDDDMRCECD